MMKQAVGLSGAALLVVALALAGGCGGGEPSVTAGVDGCAACGMLIENERQAAGCRIDGSFRPFCSAGCLLDDYERRREQGLAPPSDIVFADYERGGLHSADTAAFLLTRRLKAVMAWDFVAFASAEEALRHRLEGEEVVDWPGLRRLRGRPDRILPVVVGARRMLPEVITSEKGELVVLEMRTEELAGDLRVRVRGYEELGEIVLPSTGETVEVRFLALRPGEGFPVERVGDGRALGRIRVAGTHSVAEEEL